MSFTNMNNATAIRANDVVEVLHNAINYGEPWSPLYKASIDEIIHLRQQVLALGGSLPMSTNLMTGQTNPLRTVHHKDKVIA
jgi:hypothetical protein